MTLRGGLIGVCVVLLAVAAFLFLTGHGEGGVIALVFEAGFILAALVFERYRYNRPLDAPPGPGWEATGETFVDPGSGETMRVYFNPTTGKRVYVRVAGTKAGGG